jgi:hypothetical protein
MFLGASDGFHDGTPLDLVEQRSAAGGQIVGRIHSAVGSCVVVRWSGGTRQAQPGDVLYQGDTIETGADGAINLIFEDGTAFNLLSSARVVLSEYICDSNGKWLSALFSIVRGTFAFIAGQVAKSGRLTIDTPFASRGRIDHVGIVGADFLMQTRPAGHSGTSRGFCWLEYAL